jgi:hypothetical protein
METPFFAQESSVILVQDISEYASDANDLKAEGERHEFGE